MGCLNAKCQRVSGMVPPSVTAKCQRVPGLRASCGIVCSLSTAKVLKVEPEYIFLMEANNYTEEVCVISNVKWNVS